VINRVFGKHALVMNAPLAASITNRIAVRQV